jgi:arylsulfatase A-like enzyme
MDELWARGVAFTRAYAQAPNTPRSFPSIFTSRYPSRVKWDNPFQNYPKLLPEAVSVFELLRDGGYHTAGVSSHFYFTEERGITQGFAEYDNEGAKSIKDSNPDVASPRVVPKVKAKLAALAAGKQKFVLFTHLFEPHSTYVEHDGFPKPSSGVEGLEEKYDYEIAFVDRYVGEVVDALKETGLADDTMIVLLSDHGEAFGAHRFGGERLYFHGQTLYDELLRVPLVFIVPGVAPRQVDTPVMLLDVAPTLADAAGLTASPTFQGRSLGPAIVGQELPRRPVHAELLPAPSWKHDARMMIEDDGQTKIIYRVSENVFELYDLAADPKELEDLTTVRKERADELRRKLAAFIDSGG